MPSRMPARMGCIFRYITLHITLYFFVLDAGQELFLTFKINAVATELMDCAFDFTYVSHLVVGVAVSVGNVSVHGGVDVPTAYSHRFTYPHEHHLSAAVLGPTSFTVIARRENCGVDSKHPRHAANRCEQVIRGEQFRSYQFHIVHTTSRVYRYRQAQLT